MAPSPDSPEDASRVHNAASPLPAALAIWTAMLLDRADQRAQKVVGQQLKRLRIRARHYAMLVLLAEEGPLSQVKLGQRLHIDRTTVVFLVDELEQNGLLERRRDPADRRIHAVTLTERGRQVVVQANSRMRSAEEAFLEPLSDAERDQLRALLLRLV